MAGLAPPSEHEISLHTRLKEHETKHKISLYTRLEEGASPATHCSLLIVKGYTERNLAAKFYA